MRRRLESFGSIFFLLLTGAMLHGCQDRKPAKQKGQAPLAKLEAPAVDQKSGAPAIDQKSEVKLVVNAGESAPEEAVSEKEKDAKKALLSDGAVLLVSPGGHVSQISLSLLGKDPSTKWACLRDLPQLKCLDMNAAVINDSDLAGVDTVKQLEDLNLGLVVALSDAGLAHLENCTQLLNLSLDHTFISDAGLVHLKKLTKLRSLDLTSTQVTKAGVKMLQEALPKLKIIHDSK